MTDPQRMLCDFAALHPLQLGLLRALSALTVPNEGKGKVWAALAANLPPETRQVEPSAETLECGEQLCSMAVGVHVRKHLAHFAGSVDDERHALGVP
jgi:hypothetical protein